MALPSLMNTFHHRNHPHSDQAHVETHTHTQRRRGRRAEREEGDRTQAKKKRQTRRGEKRREGRIDTEIQVIRVDENEDRSWCGWMIT